MKRYNNLFEKIVSIDNLYLADKKARKNKSNRDDIKEFDKYKDSLLVRLQSTLIDQTYTTSKYDTFIIREPKERLIFKLPQHMTYSEYRQQVCSHIGWMKHCNGINLLKKIIKYHQLIEYARSS